ncbi:MAG: DUF91 domain-containing protein [Halodesulfurarchaeum sp.]
MQDTIRVFAGRCTIIHQADSRSEREGVVFVLVKPDNTVLVHDASGYRPAGWLTRADSLRVHVGDEHFELFAAKGTETLTVRSGAVKTAEFPVTSAGDPIGTCPECDTTMVRSRGQVTCLGCGEEYPLPRDATVTGEPCDTCGLPSIRVDRGAPIEVCLDRECQSIDEAVSEHFDGEWRCPTCETPLEIRRERTLGVACPRCETHYPIPTGTVNGTCSCGLPRFDVGEETRCLDPECDATVVTA